MITELETGAMMVFQQEILTTKNMFKKEVKPKEVKQAFVQADDLDDEKLAKKKSLKK